MAIRLDDASTSHRDWKRIFRFRDKETGDLIDFTGAFISIAVEDDNCCKRIQATTDNGKITIVDLGRFEISVPASEMTFGPGAFPMGGFFQINDETNDLFEGTLTLRRGIPKP